MKTSRVCSRCRVEKKLSLFFKDKNGPDGHYSICKDCKKAATSEWRERNRATYNAGMRAYNAKHRRRIHLKTKYQMSLADYESMLVSQGSACKICRRAASAFPRPLVIDHNHTAGRTRGLLCYGCNRELRIIENSDLFKSALEYLAEDAARFLDTHT